MTGGLVGAEAAPGRLTVGSYDVGRLMSTLMDIQGNSKTLKPSACLFCTEPLAAQGASPAQAEELLLQKSCKDLAQASWILLKFEIPS
ncbi:hypothetical protein U0070_007968 [Myodes glareolus]|uniref:Uncharacterized protein n=1 Tax=Myodes glareolus TaxID=447135 RepID=A0AAW0IGJ1_MYOGA